jgi:hypothetical protein
MASLCDMCSNLDVRQAAVHPEYAHYQSLHKLLESARNGCQLCTFFSKHCAQYWRDRATEGDRKLLRIEITEDSKTLHPEFRNPARSLSRSTVGIFGEKSMHYERVSALQLPSLLSLTRIS